MGEVRHIRGGQVASGGAEAVGPDRSGALEAAGRAADASRGDPLVHVARAAAAGDLAAAGRLVEALAPRVSAVVGALMGRSHPDVDDVTQQSLIALVQAMPAFRGECHPAGYASRIAVRTAVRARREARKRALRHERLAGDEALVSAGASPGAQVASQRRAAALRELLEQLPEEQAESLALRVVLGWSLDEVAAATGAPINTVRSRIRLAKEALRRKIEGDPALAEALGGDR